MTQGKPALFLARTTVCDCSFFAYSARECFAFFRAVFRWRLQLSIVLEQFLGWLASGPLELIAKVRMEVAMSKQERNEGSRDTGMGDSSRTWRRGSSRGRHGANNVDLVLPRFSIAVSSNSAYRNPKSGVRIGNGTSGAARR